MKTKLISICAAGVFVVALALATFMPITPNAKAAPAPAAAAASTPERHPEIDDAIRALEKAKAHMEHAAHDFGGHREDAIHATDEAIRQLKICLRY